jgi:hypothetical protein
MSFSDPSKSGKPISRYEFWKWNSFYHFVLDIHSTGPSDVCRTQGRNSQRSIMLWDLSAFRRICLRLQVTSEHIWWDLRFWTVWKHVTLCSLYVCTEFRGTSGFQAFAVLWKSNIIFFWVVPRRVIIKCRRFRNVDTLYSHAGELPKRR